MGIDGKEKELGFFDVLICKNRDFKRDRIIVPRPFPFLFVSVKKPAISDAAKRQVVAGFASILDRFAFARKTGFFDSSSTKHTVFEQNCINILLFYFL